MASDLFEIEPAPQSRGRRSCSTCLVGCLFGAVFVVALLGVATWWISQNWQRLAADFSIEATDELIDATDFPEQEKIEIKAEMARFAEAMRAGDLPLQKVGEAMAMLMESPLMTTLLVSTVEKKYLDGSGLTDEEKEQGRVDLRRFVRGVIDEKINENAVEEVLPNIADRKGGGWELRDQATDEQLRALLKAVKEKADAAEIPQEIEEVDPSDELKRIIDQTLGVEEPAAG